MLLQDPFSDEFINKASGRLVEGIHGEQGTLEQGIYDSATRAGIDPSSPAFLRAIEKLKSTSLEEAAGAREGFELNMAQERLNNIRLRAELETNRFGAVKAANAQITSARISAAAQRAAASMGLQGDMARLQFGAAQSLMGTMGQFGQPYSTSQQGPYAPQQSPSVLGGAIGGGLQGFGAGYGMSGGWGAKGGGAKPPGTDV